GRRDVGQRPPADQRQASAVATFDAREHEKVRVGREVTAIGVRFAYEIVVRERRDDWRFLVLVEAARPLEGERLDRGVVAVVEALGEGAARQDRVAVEIVEPKIGLVGRAVGVEAPAPVLVDVEATEAVDMAAELAAFAVALGDGAAAAKLYL